MGSNTLIICIHNAISVIKNNYFTQLFHIIYKAVHDAEDLLEKCKINAQSAKEKLQEVDIHNKL